MATTSPAVDAYIAEAAEFARPILEKIRSLFHKGCPQLIETMKWRFPHFEHKGVLGNMAAFKKHCNFGFWKGSLMKDPNGLFKDVGDTSMCALKVSDLGELPPDKVIIAYVKEAVALNEQGAKVERPKKNTSKVVEVPDFFLEALKKHPKALAVFEAFSPSHKREYVEYVTEAKREDTRARRLETTIAQLKQGKEKNWKYARK